MSISEPFIRRPIGTTLLAVGLLMTGLITFPMLPIAPLPQVDFPTIQVSTSLPGASAETMAASVTTPLERQFSVIAGVAELTSTSSLGTSSITVQFDLDRNIDSAAGDVLSAINAAGGQLPTNLPSPPSYKKVNPADSPILLISLTSASLPLTVVDDAADTILAQQLSQITGVAQVSINGQQKPAVRVQLDPAKIAALGLGLEDVRAQIVNASSEAPIGTFDGKDQSFAVYDNDQILAADPWNDVIVAYRNGGPVRIRDIGRAVDAAENIKLAAWANGTRCILLAVYKQPGANVIDTVDQVKAALPHLQATIPTAIDVAILSDRTQTIRASVSDVELTLVVTIVLVVAIIFLFLRSAWATIIPGVTVPLSLAGTFAAMYLLGYSLDNLSLMGLSIAVGFVVDDAIVMLENIVRHIEDGLAPLEAAIKGAGEIGFTIVSISLSLVAVFIPLLLMGGIVGRLFREFAITVTVAILISGVLALSLTPMMCARFLQSDKDAHHGRIYLFFERGFDRLLAGYERGLKGVLKHQLLTLCVFLVTLAVTVALFVFIPKSFFPEQDTGSIFGSAEGAQDISSAAMWGHLAAMNDIIRQDPAVDTIGYSAGASAFNTGTFFITLKPKGQRDATADQIIARLRPKLATVEGANLYMQVLQDIKVGGRLGRTQYQYTLQDGNLDELDVWAPKLLAKLQGLPQLADVTSDQQANAATATLTIDRDRASRFGIPPTLINATIYDAIGQRQVAQYFTQLNSYHVVLEVDPALQADARLLDTLYLTSPITMQQVPLSTFVRLDLTKTAYLAINHQSQFPAVTISFNLGGGAALGDAVIAIQQLELQLGSPRTLTGSFQGTAQAFQTSLASQPYLIAAALLVVYLILGVLYESFIHPLTILSTLPSAGVGALLMLMLFGYDLSVIALIGIIMLIGIVKKNGIMIVDFALTAQREQNLAPEEAIYQACVLRFRPIMMTTMCAIFGGVPLMVGGGTGAELRQPLGFAIVGGLLVSQALTLFTTPVVYLYLDRVNNWRWRRAAPAVPSGAVPAGMSRS
jgi:hydrophobic/amphiphilic exporter-1 (mainly G- bacteria), HAE1 family